MKKHGTWIPTAWPHDGLKRAPDGRGSLVALKDMYRAQGLYMLKKHAQYKDERKNSLDASIAEMTEYMKTGRFKVFSNLSEWFAEKRMYHREDGVIKQTHDDIISATRYAFMMRRYARIRPAPFQNKRPKSPIVS